MVKNVGVLERWIRLLLGAGMFVVAIIGEWSFVGQFVIAGIGAIAFVTGVIQFCPVWKLFGVSTCSSR